MKIKLFLIILFILLFQANGKHLYKEKYYQDLWCKEHSGYTEVKLIDDTRVDCMTKTHSIEFDFAKKWAEAIGQSLHYSRMTNKKAGIVLIIEKNSDFKYYRRIVPLCEKYDISLWYMKQPNILKENTTKLHQNKLMELIIACLKNIITELLAYF